MLSSVGTFVVHTDDRFMTSKFPALLLSVLLIAFLGCQEDEEATSQKTTTYDLNGYVQKGPFINGTAITVSELDEQLVATGKNFNTQIIDNKGTFSLKGVELQSEYVQLIAEGFYFDEVRGEKSAAQLTLFALADVSDVSSVNVNLLSHLEKDRVIYLMQEEALSFTEAKQQAQQEVLAIFGIEKSDMVAAELLDISQDGDDNAILLAISAILQGNNTVAELSELLADIITDIREDGVLDSESTQEKIRNNATLLTLSAIRENLESRYEELGVDVSIADFEQYVDSDGDGFLNNDEDDTPNKFAFESQIDVAVDTVVVSNEVTISGLKENGVSDITVSNGQLLINGQGINNANAQVKNGDKVRVQVVSSGDYDKEIKASIQIGSYLQYFSVITDDYLVDSFSFAPIENAKLGTTHASKMITLAGLKYPTPIKINGGVLFINGEEVSDIGHTVETGDQIIISLFAGHKYETTSQANLSIGSFVTSFSATTVPNPVRKLASFPGGASHGKVCFSIDEHIYVGLGHEEYSTERLKEFYRFSPDTNTWKRVADFPGASVSGVVVFTLSGKGHIALGVDSDGKPLKDIWAYDPQSDLWTKSSDFMGEARSDASAFSVGNDVYIGLGVVGTQYLKDFWKYSLTTDTWEQVGDFAGKACAGAFSFCISEKGYVGGGWTGSADTSKFWEYNPKSDQWIHARLNALQRRHNSGFLRCT